MLIALVGFLTFGCKTTENSAAFLKEGPPADYDTNRQVGDVVLLRAFCWTPEAVEAAARGQFAFRTEIQEGRCGINPTPFPGVLVRWVKGDVKSGAVVGSVWEIYDADRDTVYSLLSDKNPAFTESNGVVFDENRGQEV